MRTKSIWKACCPKNTKPVFSAHCWKYGLFLIHFSHWQPSFLFRTLTLSIRYWLRKGGRNMKGLRNQPWYPLLPLVPIHILAYICNFIDCFYNAALPSLALGSVSFMWDCAFICCFAFGKMPSGWNSMPFSHWCFSPVFAFLIWISPLEMWTVSPLSSPCCLCLPITGWQGFFIWKS